MNTLLALTGLILMTVLYIPILDQSKVAEVTSYTSVLSFMGVRIKLAVLYFLGQKVSIFGGIIISNNLINFFGDRIIMRQVLRSN